MHRKTLLELQSYFYWNDSLTAISLLLFISYLYFTNIYLRLGSFEALYIIYFLVFIEVVKYLNCIAHDSNFGSVSLGRFLFNAGVVGGSFVAIYVIAVLFGAPVLSAFEQTAMFALLVTTLTAFPMCMHLGGQNTIDMFLSLTEFEGDAISTLFMTKLRLTLFGAWLGAIVIPLDWNRSWQKWPVPNCVGTLVGYFLSNVVTLVLQSRTQRVTKKMKHVP